MRRFLRDISITLFLAATLTAALLPCLRRNTINEYTAKRDYVETHAANIATLIVGHSQSEVGIDPSVFDRAYNMAQSARLSHYDARLLELYVPRMPNLKAVVYPLCCEYEAGRVLTDPAYGQSQWFSYRCFMGLPVPLRLREPFHEAKYVELYIKNLLFFNNMLCGDHHDSLGFYSLGDSWSDRNNVFEATGTDTLVHQSLLDMARVCSRHGVRLIVVTSPCNSTYRASHSSCPADLQRLVGRVAEAYPVEYHCYLDDARFPDFLFSDQTHLNSKGARLFSEILRADWGL